MCSTSGETLEVRWDELGPNIWTAWRPLKFLGVSMGTRMTVVRTAAGKLWLHSPYDPGPQIRAQMDELGPVSYAVCPNRMHHMLVGQILELYPEARLFLSTALPKKRPDLAHGQVLGDDCPQEWEGDIRVLRLQGPPWLDEQIFLHQPSGTLILTDLMWCVDEEFSAPVRGFARLVGQYKKHVVMPEIRVSFTDKKAARATVETILDWDFERIVLAHGPIVMRNGRQILRKAFNFLF